MNPQENLETVEKAFFPGDDTGGSMNFTIPIGKLPEILQEFRADHQNALYHIGLFEKSLILFKNSGFKLTDELSAAFKQCFGFFKDSLLGHHRKEEKDFYPYMHKKLIGAGVHNYELIPRTAIDGLEDDHVKFIQLETLTSKLFSLASNLKDEASKNFIYEIAFDNGKELIELLRLHIYQEENHLFPLACKIITEEEFKAFN